MKKIIYILTLLSLFFDYSTGTCLFAHNLINEKQSDRPEENCKKIIEKVFTQSPAYKTALTEYEQRKLARAAYKFRWVPHPIIDAGYTGTFYTGTDKNPQNVIKGGFAVYQGLPAGIRLQAQAEQFFGIQKKNAGQNATRPSYEYDFDSSAGLSFPLYVAAPSLLSAAIKSELYTHTLLADTAAIDLRSARKRILAMTVSRIGSYLLLKERIDIEEQREILRQKEAFSDNALWETGEISSLELSERTTKRYEQYLTLLQMKENLSILQGDFYDLGLTEEDIPASIDLWLTDWEDFIGKNKIENGLEFDAEEKKLTLYFYNKAEQGLLSLPKITLSARASPSEAMVSKSGIFTSSISDYWNKAQNWEWSLNAGIKISLFPFDREYLVQKEFSLALQEYNNAQISLTVYRQNKEKSYKNSIELLQKLSDKAEREKTDAYNKIRTASTLQNQGYLSETSFTYHKLNALLAEHNCKEIKLRRISALLEGY